VAGGQLESGRRAERQPGSSITDSASVGYGERPMDIYIRRVLILGLVAGFVGVNLLFCTVTSQRKYTPPETTDIRFN